MRFDAPHPIPYQGSKRLLAPAILSLAGSGRFERLFEPFAGSAAITLAAAKRSLFKKYVISDLLRPLSEIWMAIMNDPQELAKNYRIIWESQLNTDPTAWFNEVRAEFNLQHDPAKLLFLLARCVKNAVRFSSIGEFNQSPDKRRRGMHPRTMAKEIQSANALLSGNCEVLCGDFRDVLKRATPSDLIYMDPPYQGTSEGRDRRYIKGVQRAEMVELLSELNSRGIEYIVSYDGQCGDKEYGEPLPPNLNAHRVLIEVGRSSQATLNGKDHLTVESVYLSPGLHRENQLPGRTALKAFAPQSLLFSQLQN